VIVGFGVLGALSGFVVGSGIASVVGTYLFFRLLSSRTGDGQFRGSFLSSAELLVRYGFPLYISAFLQSFVLQYQNILLALFTSDIAIGNFKAATNFSTTINTLALAVTPILLTAFSKLNHEKEETRNC